VKGPKEMKAQQSSSQASARLRFSRRVSVHETGCAFPFQWRPRETPPEKGFRGFHGRFKTGPNQIDYFDEIYSQNRFFLLAKNFTNANRNEREKIPILCAARMLESP
jgi:hypothetical protein